jgi:tryptophan synthase alpha chain
MNRINKLFETRSGNMLSIYFTAGYPDRDDTTGIIRSLAQAGADMVEIGIPFSDPMADGPVIQQSSERALKNGMSLKLLFHQLKDIRKAVDIPLLLMGYLNPVMQYGMEKFCQDCATTGIDGVILPDLPLEVFQGNPGILPYDHHHNNMQHLFAVHNLYNIFLVSPQTSEARIRMIDENSRGFIYMVSSSSTTGARSDFLPEQISYFERIRAMKLANPAMIGFGITNRENFRKVCHYAQGAIIGSAFVKMLGEKGFSQNMIRGFIESIK